MSVSVQARVQTAYRGNMWMLRGFVFIADGYMFSDTNVIFFPAVSCTYHIHAQPVYDSFYDWCSSTLTGMSTAGCLNSLDWMSERQTSVYVKAHDDVKVKTKLWN